jgi:glycosyltransferase involved in cell wall biosynthesis
LIESLACGTPVLAYRRGSIPELIEDGVTGFICESLSEMVRAVERVPPLDRRRCRQSFETRFAVRRMAEDYLALYERLRAAVPIRPYAPASVRNHRVWTPDARVFVPETDAA